MPISFSPTLGEHVEFDATNQTVSVVEPADLQFEIQNVTYHHELGMTFSDMVISVSSALSLRWNLLLMVLVT